MEDDHVGFSFNKGLRSYQIGVLDLGVSINLKEEFTFLFKYGNCGLDRNVKGLEARHFCRHELTG